VKTPIGAEVSFVRIAGIPFREPIVPSESFEMNTEDEIRLAVQILWDGTFVKN
jgi:hypothetical protein